MPSGSAAKMTREYYLSPYLNFLDNFLKSRPTKSNLNKYDNIDGNDSEDIDETLLTEQLASENSDFNSYQSTPTPPPSNKSGKITIKDVNKVAHDYFTQKAMQRKTIALPEIDSDLAFFQSMLPDMKTMTPTQKRRFKMGVLNLSEQILNEQSPTSSTRQPYSPRTLYQENPISDCEGTSTQLTLTSRSNKGPAPSVTLTKQTTGKSSENQTSGYYGEEGQPFTPTLEGYELGNYRNLAPQHTRNSGVYGVPELQTTQTPRAYEGETLAPPATPTRLYLPMFSPVTPATPQPNPETLIRSRHDEVNDYNVNCFNK